ncbi:glycosyltransferase [Tateyamaria sp.]|uniref:glycosyltransferase n=1 Tax=Tateyamaria sp. TaxID=1929288 RepID=UPI00329E6CE7
METQPVDMLRPTRQPPPLIHVLMAVFDGGDCLDEQLHSIVSQSHPDWHLYTSDDGSSDETPEILQRLSDQLNSEKSSRSLTRFQGPRLGAAENFMSLLRRLADAQSGIEWLSFSDQDDVWLPHKMARGLEALSHCDHDVPTLYCSRTWITAGDLSERRMSVARSQPPSFRNALVQNIASGNTILLNPAATKLVLRSAMKVDEVVVHDWWVYQLITGAGGTVIHDDTPGLLYRQHASNQIGANDTWRARLKRLNQLLRGDFSDWNKVNVEALNRTLDELTEENRKLLIEFAKLPQLSLGRRLSLLRKIGLYRQTLPSTVAIWIAAVLNRI